MKRPAPVHEDKAEIHEPPAQRRKWNLKGGPSSQVDTKAQQDDVKEPSSQVNGKAYEGNFSRDRAESRSLPPKPECIGQLGQPLAPPIRNDSIKPEVDDDNINGDERNPWANGPLPPQVMALPGHRDAAGANLSVQYQTSLFQPKREFPAFMEAVQSQPMGLPTEVVQSQPKREFPAPVEVIQSQLSLSQPKRERVPPMLGSHGIKQEQHEEEAKLCIAAEPPLPRPIQHPTGIWLGALGHGAPPRQGTEPMTIDGVTIPRATWSPATGVVSQKCSLTHSFTATSGGGNCSTNTQRNFKLFSKSRRQCASRRNTVVPLVPWKQPAKASLSELFGSQPLEPESQGPPLYL